MMAAMANDVPRLLDEILNRAIERGVSDVHIEPTAAGHDIRCRIDGLLQNESHHEPAEGRALVTRLMVLAQLLTYRHDVPQEGRIQFSPSGAAGNGDAIDLRVSIMPTTHGLRAAVRLPADLRQPRSLDRLGLPSAVLAGLEEFAAADSGLLLLTGPAGSGKTTTIYALLQHILRTSPGLSVISIEDPVERQLAGVTQIEVSSFGELTFDRCLRSVLRHDPQVLALGEIRDRETASLAVQAALSGHRLISTMHAAEPGGAIARLFEMGLEPYQITSALFGVVAIRLVRRGTAERGYAGRVPVAEFVAIDAQLRKAVLDRADASTLDMVYKQRSNYKSLRASADDLIARGVTDRPEVDRVLGERRN